MPWGEGEPEPAVLVALDRPVPVPVRGPAILRADVPTAAAKDALLARIRALRVHRAERDGPHNAAAPAKWTIRQEKRRRSLRECRKILAFA